MGMGMACYWVEAERVNMGCCDIVIWYDRGDMKDKEIFFFLRRKIVACNVCEPLRSLLGPIQVQVCQVRRQRQQEQQHHLFTMWCVSKLDLWLSRLERNEKWIIFKTRHNYACFVSALFVFSHHMIISTWHVY
jgi:hypothetical protein